MADDLKPLLDLAFERVPAIEANARIAEKRGEEGPTQRTSYEVLIPEGKGLAWFLDEVVPRFVYHLECRGVRPPEAEGFFLSLFAGDSLYFVTAKDALRLVCERTGLSPEELVKRYGTGELRTAIRREPEKAKGPPLALPGPGSKSTK